MRWVALLILSSLCLADSVAEVNLTVNQMCTVYIQGLTASPKAVTQGGAVSIQAEIFNGGNMNATSSLTFTILRGNLTVDALASTPIFLTGGERATIVTQLSTAGRDAGKYYVVANISSSSSVPCQPSPELSTEFDVIAPTPTLVPAAAAPAVPVIPPVIPVEVEVKWVRMPVLVELGGGGEKDVIITVQNIGGGVMSEVIRIDGVPTGWISFFPSRMDLSPKERMNITIKISPPADAPIGDYAVRVYVGERMNYFILRVRPAPPEDRPTVDRRVEVDREEGKVVVALEVVGGKSQVKAIELVEEIPEDVAPSMEMVKFSRLPMVEGKRLVKWILRDLMPHESRIIWYEVQRIPSDYASCIYWPLRQMNIFYSARPPALQVDVHVPPLFAGRSGSIIVDLKNTLERELTVTVELRSPAGWRIDPQSINVTVGPKKSESVKFSVIPPSVGTSMLHLWVMYDGDELRKDLVATVSPAPVDVWIAFPAGVAAFGTFAMIRRRRIARRIERVRALRLIEYRQRRRM